MNENAHVRSRCRNRALDCKNTSEVLLSRSGRCPIRAIGLHLKSFSTLSGFFFAVIRSIPSGCIKPYRESDSTNRADAIDIISNLSESTASGSPACSKSVHQRTQTAFHAYVKAMFSDWLRLNIRNVKNAKGSSERNDDSKHSILVMGLLCPLG